MLRAVGAQGGASRSGLPELELGGCVGVRSWTQERPSQWSAHHPLSHCLLGPGLGTHLGTVHLPFLTWWSVAVRSLLSPEHHVHPSTPHPPPVFPLPTFPPTNSQPLLCRRAISRDGGVGSCSKGGPERCGGLPTSHWQRVKAV